MRIRWETGQIKMFWSLNLANQGKSCYVVIESLFYTQYKMDEDTSITSRALIWSNVRDKTPVNFGQEDAYRLEAFVWC